MYSILLLTLNLLIAFTNQRSINIPETKPKSELTEDEINDIFGYKGKEDPLFIDDSNQLEGEDIHRSRKRRGISKYTPWPKVNGELIIPYVFDESMTNPAHRERIEKFITEMNSIIRCNANVWRPRTDEQFYVTFKLSNGCWSWIGKLPLFYQPQEISLSIGCIEWNGGSVLHEMMHAMGFFHEQSRSDRDDYVRINWNNIIEDAKDNFKKEDTISLGSPYDYGSVMHYSPYIFNIGDQPTMTKIDTTNTERMGQRDGLSKYDIEQINSFYQCPKVAIIAPTTTSTTTTPTTTTTTTPTTTTTTTTTTPTTTTTTTPTTTTTTPTTTTTTPSTTTTTPTTTTTTTTTTPTTTTTTTPTTPTTTTTTTTPTTTTTTTPTTTTTTPTTTTTTPTTTATTPTTTTTTPTTTTTTPTTTATTPTTTPTTPTTTTTTPTTTTTTPTTTTTTPTTTPTTTTTTPTTTTTKTTTTTSQPEITICPQELCNEPTQSNSFVFSRTNPRNPQQFITCIHFFDYKFTMGCQFCVPGYVFDDSIDVQNCIMKV